MSSENDIVQKQDIPCTNPSGKAGDVWRDEDSDPHRILIKTCSPYGHGVETGSELKDKS